MDRDFTLIEVMKRPSALLPLAMSLAALILVLFAVFFLGAAPGGDEGGIAHTWQLLMLGQMPFVLFFVVKWLPRAPKQGLAVFAGQAGAAFASFAAVFFFHLG